MKSGAQGGTRTPTDYSTRPSSVRGYQLRHLSKFFKTNNTNYLFAGTLVDAAFDAGATFAAGGTATLALASAGDATLAFESAAFVTVSSAGVSGLLVSTETLPVSAGIERNSADSINNVAAAIVTFESIVAVPRGARAELETLLVNKAPASVLPGCNSTAAMSVRQERKKIPYKK